uniref:NADH dehydrogenase subunit 3 n=1 Tax=Panagrolaimus davidi TaxID=227884 RepID=A0A914P8J5_9BILA
MASAAAAFVEVPIESRLGPPFIVVVVEELLLLLLFSFEPILLLDVDRMLYLELTDDFFSGFSASSGSCPIEEKFGIRFAL